MKHARSLSMTVAVVAWLTGGASDGFAYPEFVRHGYFSCVSCHVSPAGGATLTDYGRSYAAEKLSTWAKPGEEAPLHGVAGATPEWFVVGGNFRQIQTVTESANARSGRWIAMQRELEGCVRVAATWSCVSGRVMPDSVAAGEPRYGVGRAQVRVDFGEALVLRAGRFTPRYGLMIANHTSSIRRGLGFDAGADSDQIEATLLSERTELTVYRDFGRVMELPGDRDEVNDAFAPAWGLSAAVFLFESSRLGLSARRTEADQATQTSAGVFVAAGITDKTFVLAEIDQKRTAPKDPPDGAPRLLLGSVSHLRAGHEIHRGVVPYLLHEVDFKDLRDGRTRQDKFGLGVQWYPRPHFEIEGFVGHLLKRQDFSYASAAYLLLHYYL